MSDDDPGSYEEYKRERETAGKQREYDRRYMYEKSPWANMNPQIRAVLIFWIIVAIVAGAIWAAFFSPYS